MNPIKNADFVNWRSISLILLLLSTLIVAKEPAEGTVLTAPITIDREGLDFVGKEGFLIVPENRNKPDSRKITVHFFTFPAKEPADLPPVFYLPGGPGGYYSVRHFYQYYGGKRALAWTTELKALNKNRDLIIVNQRGNSRVPGLNSSDWRWRINKWPLDRPWRVEEAADLFSQAVDESIDDWSGQGIDLSGYDIINIVDDLEDLRQALGYQKIALCGSSFGSQWALAYIRRWPRQVDRALLAGIEPLDHTYDSPQDIWRALERLEMMAGKDSNTRPMLKAPPLTVAVREILDRLESSPVEISVWSPDENDSLRIIIGPDDFRRQLTASFRGARRESLEFWPKFIREIYDGDYRFLALLTAEERESNYAGAMIGDLIDHSLGISMERAAKLKGEVARVWLGDVNAFYKAIRPIMPTAEVDDDFRRPQPIDVPVLMVQGDLDFSTPLENAHYLLPHLSNGYLVTVKGGTHSVMREIILERQEAAEKILAFMEKVVPGAPDFYQQLPKEIDLTDLSFRALAAPSLYEMAIDE